MRRTVDVVYWVPRVLSILFLLFLSLFSLDVFSMRLGFWETVAGPLIHNIPAFILLAALIVAWQHEIVGGVAFLLAGFLYAALVLSTAVTGQFEWFMLVWILQISGIAFLIGILFLVGWARKRRTGRARGSHDEGHARPRSSAR